MPPCAEILRFAAPVLRPRAAGRGALLAASAALCAACASVSGPGGTASAPPLEPTARVEVQEDIGFTITEEVWIGNELRQDYERALQLLRQERYEEGIVLLAGLTERAPQVTAPHIDLGIAYRLSGDFESAEQSLLRAVELNPQHPIAHNELGMVYRRTGRFEQARRSYDRALALYPGFHYARRNLAILCDLFLADLVCALEHYEAYSEAVPDDAQAAMWITDIRNRIARQENQP